MDCVNMTHLIVKTQQQWLQRLTCERDETLEYKKESDGKTAEGAEMERLS